MVTKDICCISWSRNSVICIVIILPAGQPRNHGSNPGRGKRFFSSLNCWDRSCSPPIFLYNCYWCLFPPGQGGWVVKLDHLHSVSAKVKNELSYDSSFSSALMVCMGSDFPYLDVPVPILLKKVRIESWITLSTPYLTICCRLSQTNYTPASVSNCNTLRYIWQSSLFFYNCIL